MKSIVYNKDWRLTTFKYPDKYFDWVIDDIPYGINVGNMNYIKNQVKKVSQKNGKTYKVKEKIYTSKNWDNSTPDQSYFNEMQRISKNQIIFGVEYVNWSGLGTGRIKWNKGVPKKMSFKDYELAYCSSINHTHEINLLWSGMMQAESLKNPLTQQGNKALNEKRIQPCQKPILLYKKIALDFNLFQKKIYCGHNGSGSDRIAFDDYVEEFIANEIDKDYFESQEIRYKSFKANEKINFNI